MNSQDLQNLQEAYSQIYQLDESDYSERISKIRSKKPRMRDKDGYPISIGHGVVKTPEQHSRQTNLDTHSIETRVTTDKQLRRHYDRIGRNIASLKKEELEAIIEFLCLEGYADTPEQAEVIVVNMSEDWRESIVEEILDEARGEGPEAADPGSQLSQQLFRGVKKNRGSKLTRQDTASVPGKGSKANRRMQNN